MDFVVDGTCFAQLTVNHSKQVRWMKENGTWDNARSREKMEKKQRKIDWHNFIDLISPCFMRCRCIIGKILLFLFLLENLYGLMFIRLTGMTKTKSDSIRYVGGEVIVANETLFTTTKYCIAVDI